MLQILPWNYKKGMNRKAANFTAIPSKETMSSLKKKKVDLKQKKKIDKGSCKKFLSRKQILYKGQGTFVGQYALHFPSFPSLSPPKKKWNHNGILCQVSLPILLFHSFFRKVIYQTKHESNACNLREQ